MWFLCTEKQTCLVANPTNDETVNKQEHGQSCTPVGNVTPVTNNRITGCMWVHSCIQVQVKAAGTSMRKTAQSQQRAWFLNPRILHLAHKPKWLWCNAGNASLLHQDKLSTSMTQRADTPRSITCAMAESLFMCSISACCWA